MGETMKKADEGYIKKEENEFLGKEIKNKFPKGFPFQEIRSYDSINVEMLYAPDYTAWIHSNIYAALTTWDSEPERPVSNLHECGEFREQEKRLLYILKQRPISAVLESAVFQFKITGLPRSMTHQLVRHRGMSFNQESFRVSSCYSCSVRAPQELYVKRKLKLLNEYSKVVKQCRNMYKKLIDNGVPVEQARNIMPMGTLTKITATMRLKDMIDYFKARTLDIAQDEDKKYT